MPKRTTRKKTQRTTRVKPKSKPSPRPVAPVGSRPTNPSSPRPLTTAVRPWTTDVRPKIHGRPTRPVNTLGASGKAKLSTKKKGKSSKNKLVVSGQTLRAILPSASTRRRW